MSYQGFVKKDSLKDDGFLNFAIYTKEEGDKIIFEVSEEFAASIVSEMSEELRSGANFGVVQNDYIINIIFPEKICTYAPTDHEGKEKMFKYAESLGISPKELESI